MENARPQNGGIAVKSDATDLFEVKAAPREEREESEMSKKISEKLASTKKWLERNAEVGPTIKAAQAALATAEKAAADTAAARAKLAEAEASKKISLAALDDAIAKAKMEKRLKAKGAKIQAKLSSLVPGR